MTLIFVLICFQTAQIELFKEWIQQEERFNNFSVSLRGCQISTLVGWVIQSLKLVSNASFQRINYDIPVLDIDLYSWQSADILDPLFKLGVGTSGNTNIQIYSVIEKYLRIIQFRVINSKTPSKQKQNFSLLYVLTLLESKIHQKNSQNQGRKSSVASQQDKLKLQLIHSFTHAISITHRIFSSCIDQKNQAQIILAFLKSLNDMRLQQNLKMPVRCFFATLIAFIIYNIRQYIKKNNEDFLQYRSNQFIQKLSQLREDKLRKPIFTLSQQIESNPNIGNFPFRFTQQYLNMIWQTVNQIPQIKTKASILFERDLFKMSKFQNILLNCIQSHANNDNKQRFLHSSFHQIVLRQFDMQREVTLSSVAEAYLQRHSHEKRELTKSLNFVGSEQFKSVQDKGKSLIKQFFNIQCRNLMQQQQQQQGSQVSILATSRSESSTKDPIRRAAIQNMYPIDQQS